MVVASGSTALPSESPAGEVQAAQTAQTAQGFVPLTWVWRDEAIRYAVQGEGPPVVLIHGFGASIGHWKKNIPELVAAGYQVYALDLLGFGGSAKPDLAYSLELWQDLMVDFCREVVGAPVAVVGNSIGALLSLMLAVNHPDWIRGAALLNCAGGLNHRPGDLNPILGQVMQIFSNIVSSEGFGPLVFNLVRRKPQIKRALYQVYGNREAVTDELVEMLYAPSCDPGAQKVFASILTAPAGPSPRELLPLLDRPLLVLWGESDPWTPVNGAKIFQDYASTKNIQYVGLPKTGHCPHDDRPELVNPVLVRWLRETLSFN